MMATGDETNVVFPNDLTKLTPDVLTAALSDRAPGVSVERLDIVAAKRCGDGVASTADRVVIDLTYADGTGEALPRRVVLKTMLATPHAPAAMYQNEVRFYGELRGELDIEAPVAFASHFDEPSGRFGLLLEDLTARGAHFPSAIELVTLEQVQTLLGHLATLHARFWNSPRFDDALSWVATPLSGGMFEVFDLIGFELIADQVSRHPFKADLLAPLGRSLEELVRTTKGGVFNNAAQVWNHTFYWNSLSPSGGGAPTGALADAIDATWGSFAAFQDAFSKAAAGQFGSGWAWLVKGADGKLAIVTTGNAETPLTQDGVTPVLTCDVWEHAYYVDYRNNRANYIAAWWKLVNWAFAAENFGA
jgi:Fe-Mn family superoxide dismutase